MFVYIVKIQIKAKPVCPPPHSGHFLRKVCKNTQNKMLTYYNILHLLNFMNAFTTWILFLNLLIVILFYLKKWQKPTFSGFNRLGYFCTILSKNDHCAPMPCSRQQASVLPLVGWGGLYCKVVWGSLGLFTHEYS